MNNKIILICIRKVFTNGTIEYIGTGIQEKADVVFGKNCVLLKYVLIRANQVTSSGRGWRYTYNI